jgi:tetratricopeptide (TPR) repeat protein
MSTGERLNLLSRRAAETVQRQEWPLALLVYEELVTLIPQDPRVHYNKGLVHVKLEQWEQAKGEFESAITLKPDYTLAEDALKNVWLELLRQEPVALPPASRDAVTLPATPPIPDDASPLPAAQRLAVGAALVADTLAALEHTDDLMHDSINQLTLEGKAAKEIEFGLSILRDPAYERDPGARALLAQAVTALGDEWTRIARGKKELLAVTVNDTAATRYQGDYNRAEQTATRYLSETLAVDDTAHARYVLGLFRHICQGRPDEAIVELRKAVALDPTGPDGLAATQRLVRLKAEGHHVELLDLPDWGRLLLHAGHGFLCDALAQLTPTTDLIQGATHQSVLEGRLAKEIELGLTTMREGLALDNTADAYSEMSDGLLALGAEWVRVAQGRKVQMTATQNAQVAARFRDDLARAEAAAERCLREARSLRETARVHIEQGIFDDTRDQYADAVTAFRAALALDPDGDTGLEAVEHLVRLQHEHGVPEEFTDAEAAPLLRAGCAFIGEALALLPPGDVEAHADTVQSALEGSLSRPLACGILALRAALTREPQAEARLRAAEALGALSAVWSRVACGTKTLLDATPADNPRHARLAQDYTRAEETAERLVLEALDAGETAAALTALGRLRAYGQAQLREAAEVLGRAITLDPHGDAGRDAAHVLTNLLMAGHELKVPDHALWGPLMLQEGDARLCAALAGLRDTGNVAADAENQEALEGPLAAEIDHSLATLRRAIPFNPPAAARAAIAASLARLGATWCRVAMGKKRLLGGAGDGVEAETLRDEYLRAVQTAERYLSESMSLTETAAARYYTGLYQEVCVENVALAAQEYRHAVQLELDGDEVVDAVTRLARLYGAGHTPELLDGDRWAPLLARVGSHLIAAALGTLPRTDNLVHDADNQMRLENTLVADIALGVELLEDALEMNPDQAVREGIAAALTALGVEWTRVAQGRKARLPDAMDEMRERTLADLQRALGQAERFLVEALSAQDTPDTRVALGRFRAGLQGRYGDSLREFRHAVRLDPNSPAGRDAAKLFMLQEAQGLTANVDEHAAPATAQAAIPPVVVPHLAADAAKPANPELRVGTVEDAQNPDINTALQRGPQVSGQKRGCYIATACYGDYDHPDVRVLRRFRDAHLLPTPAGRLFVRCYYFLSPPLAARLAHVGWLARFLRRVVLEPLVRRLSR